MQLCSLLYAWKDGALSWFLHGVFGWDPNGMGSKDRTRPWWDHMSRQPAYKYLLSCSLCSWTMLAGIYDPHGPIGTRLPESGESEPNKDLEAAYDKLFFKLIFVLSSPSSGLCIQRQNYSLRNNTTDNGDGEPYN